MIVPEIETARLNLRAFTEADIPELLPLIGAREVAATTLRIAHPYTEQNARDFIAKTRDDDKIWLAITQRADGRLMRRRRADARSGTSARRTWLLGWRALLGQRLTPRKPRRRWCNTDLTRSNSHRILASCMSHNSASGKILVKLGMRHEGCQREHQRKWGRVRGSWIAMEFSAASGRARASSVV